MRVVQTALLFTNRKIIMRYSSITSTGGILADEFVANNGERKLVHSKCVGFYGTDKAHHAKFLVECANKELEKQQDE